MFPLLPASLAAHLADEHARILRMEKELQDTALIRHARMEERAVAPYLTPALFAELERQHGVHV